MLLKSQMLKLSKIIDSLSNVTKKISTKVTQIGNDEGVLSGVFSVSLTKKVRFSKGNLQYRASVNEWRFAEKQYDVIGADNKNISSTYDGWISLFAYGACGARRMPYYNEDGNQVVSLGAGNGNYLFSVKLEDWGSNVSIKNGGGDENIGIWKTLKYSEMYYMLYSRSNASSLLYSSTVEGVKGIVLLPDDWSDDTIFVTSDRNDYTKNVFAENQWVELEQKGAVFLPNEGIRTGSQVVGQNGSYWLAADIDCYFFYASTGNYTISVPYFVSDGSPLCRNISSSTSYGSGSNVKKCIGRCVRLVMEVK